MKALRILLIVLPFVVLSVFLINKQNADVPKYNEYVYIPKLIKASDIQTAELLSLTNKSRLASGVKPLKENPALAKSATEKCNDMLNRNYWSHTAPDGTLPWIFIEKNIVKPKKEGENLAMGYPNAELVVTSWMQSDAHRPNMLDTQYTDVGFAVCKSTIKWVNGVNLIVVQHFAQI